MWYHDVSCGIPFQNFLEQFHLSGQGCAFGRMLDQGRAVLEKIRAENWVDSIISRAQTDKNARYQEPQNEGRPLILHMSRVVKP